MKRVGILLVLGFLIVSCRTVPDVIQDNSGAVIDTQATIAAGAASVTAGAANLETGAAGIAVTLVAMAEDNPTLTSIAARAADHAEATKAHARETRKLEGDVAKARIEVIAVVSRAARMEGLYHEEHEGRVKAEGQRNTARVALGGLIVILIMIVVIKSGLLTFLFKKVSLF